MNVRFVRLEKRTALRHAANHDCCGIEQREAEQKKRHCDERGSGALKERVHADASEGDADKQAARIAEKYFGRREIVRKKPQAGSGEAEGKHSDENIAVNDVDDGE